MDQELKAYLERLSQQITESNAETRRELTDRMLAMNTETRRMVADQVSGQISETRRELTARMVTLNGETRGHSEQLHREARILIEEVGKNVGLVWEGVQAIKESLDTRLDDHEHRLQKLERKAL